MTSFGWQRRQAAQPPEKRALDAAEVAGMLSARARSQAHADR